MKKTLKSVLLVSGSNYSHQVYQGLHELKQEGISLSLLSDGTFSPDMTVFDRHFTAELRRTQDTLRYMSEQSVKFDAVVNKSSEWLTPLTALLAEHYGTPSVSPYVAFLCRSKLHMREAFLNGGLQTPRFRLCKSFEEIRLAVQEFGVLCVAKPIGGNASYGTFQIGPEDNFEQSESYYIKAVEYLRKKAVDQDMFAFDAEELGLLGVEGVFDMVDDYLVEEFLLGTQVSIDSLVRGGEVFPLGIAHQVRMKPPFFVQLAERMPFQCSSELEAQILRIQQEAIRALGISIGATHAEIILTDDGPRVLEVACRIGGDNIHDSIFQTSGYHLLKESIYLHLGESRPLVPKRSAHVAMQYLIPDTSGILEEIQIADHLRNDTAITELEISAQKGDFVAPPPESYDFLGYVQVRGATAEEALLNLERVCAGIRFRISHENLSG